MASDLLPDAPGGDRPGRRPTTAARRRERAEAIIAATRALFDERGVRDAQIDDIARAVGVNRAIIYRHFTGKEELFGLTLVGYLDELAGDLRDADDTSADPATRLRALTGAFHDFGMTYPAFVDCAQMLMRNTGSELFAEFSEGAVFRLGRAIAQCLGHLVEVLEAGVEAGQFHIADPHLLANTLYAQGLGTMQLARVGLLVKEAGPGMPTVAPLPADQVRDYLVAASVAMAVGIDDEQTNAP
ncbi:MAG TPA: TetR/AcrR family transcriptional regulator [Nocardioidaceae bacterium]|nr:TetR/AcrR family transcriptional regulator [Nocardioidaceae bacterium]